MERKKRKFTCDCGNKITTNREEVDCIKCGKVWEISYVGKTIFQEGDQIEKLHSNIVRLFDKVIKLINEEEDEDLVKNAIAESKDILDELIQSIAFSRMNSFEDGKKKEIDSFVENFPTVEDIMDEVDECCDEDEITDIIEFICERIGLVPLTEKVEQVKQKRKLHIGAKVKIECKCGNPIGTNKSVVDCLKCGRVFTIIIDNEPDRRKQRKSR